MRSLLQGAAQGKLRRPDPGDDHCRGGSTAPDPTHVLPPKLDYDSLTFGRQKTQWFYSAEVDSLWAHTLPMVQPQMGRKDKWTEMVAQFAERGGMESDLIEER